MREIASEVALFIELNGMKFCKTISCAFPIYYFPIIPDSPTQFIGDPNEIVEIRRRTFKLTNRYPLVYQEEGYEYNPIPE